MYANLNHSARTRGEGGEASRGLAFSLSSFGGEGWGEEAPAGFWRASVRFGAGNGATDPSIAPLPDPLPARSSRGEGGGRFL